MLASLSPRNAVMYPRRVCMLSERDYDVSEELEAMVTAEGVEEQAGPSIELNLLQHALLRLFGAYLAFVSSR